nr:hypothetical protein [Candidatus Njordarchaeum guaymaensis]
MTGQNPLLASVTEVEAEILQLWKEYDPSSAYAAGFEEYAGRIFNPTDSNIKSLKARILEILRKAKEENQRKFLLCIDTALDFLEPYRVISAARDTFFAHIIKDGGVNVQHMLQLADNAKTSISTSSEKLAHATWPTEIKVVTCQSCDELKGLLDTINGQTSDQTLKNKIRQLVEIVADYRKTFQVEGIIEGDFTEVFPILEKNGGDVGHRKIYPKILKNMYDYYETPAQVEQKGLRQLKKELPLFERVVKELAETYQCKPTYEDVSKTMVKRSEIPKAKIIEYVSNTRKKLLLVLGTHLVRITPKYDTRVIETPRYLVNFIPTAATTAFNLLTDKPFSIFFVTTDEKRSPPSGSADMIQTVVHEETGHCVHFQNSSTAFGAKPSVVELLDSYLAYAISDAISFHREYEFLNLLKQLAEKDKILLSKEEKEFLNAIKGEKDLNEALLENELIVMQWRLFRFLRAIFDARVNMGKQTVTEFVKWASKLTGLKEKAIFNQTFFFLSQVGYAPVYFIVGDALRQIQEKGLRRGVALVDFNTYASSIGYGARTVFEKKLRDYIKAKEKPKPTRKKVRERSRK